MKIFSNLVGLLKSGRKETFVPEEINITPEIEGQLQQLGLDETVYLYDLAAKTLHNFPDSFETLKKMSKKSLTHNWGAPYHMIKNYGTQKVNDTLDRYGGENSEHLDHILSAINKYGKGIVDEISDKFGLKDVRTIAPHYEEYDEDLTRIIINECDDKEFYLSKFFPIYRELQEAKEKSVGEETKHYEIIFKGEVQDVGFRSTSEDYAKICEISCNPMNLSNGSVLCDVQGQDPLVDLFILVLNDRFNVSKVKKKEIYK